LEIEFMSLSAAQTAELLKKYGRHENDTGSPEAQVAVLTARLNYLNDHFKAHGKDHHSRTGLMKLVGRRRRLLDFLHRQDYEGYKKLISDLGIRK
jgi:small subunit ribosomal protein S15